MSNHLLFAVGPYLAIALFAGGAFLQYVRAGQAAHVAPRPRVAAAFIAVALLLLMAHLAGLAKPQWVLMWNRVPLRLYALEIGLFLIGLVAFVGCGAAMLRHLRSADGSPAALADCAAAALLCLATGSGLAVAGVYRWASTWGVAVVSPYVISLLRLAPKESVFDTMPFALRLHVISALATLAVLPLTTPGRLVAVALHRRAAFVVGRVEGRLIAAVAALREWIEERALAGDVLPEEEE
jgi:nitrate reductase gamma subunit